MRRLTLGTWLGKSHTRRGEAERRARRPPHPQNHPRRRRCSAVLQASGRRRRSSDLLSRPRQPQRCHLTRQACPHRPPQPGLRCSLLTAISLARRPLFHRHLLQPDRLTRLASLRRRHYKSFQISACPPLLPPFSTITRPPPPRTLTPRCFVTASSPLARSPPRRASPHCRPLDHAAAARRHRPTPPGCSPALAPFHMPSPLISTRRRAHGRPLRSPHAPAAAALPLCRVTATAASLAGHQTSLPR